MNFIEQKLQNYLHCILALIEHNCTKLIASDNISVKIDTGIVIGRLGQAAEQLNARINEIFDHTPPRKCSETLLKQIRYAQQTGRFQKLQSWLNCDIKEYIRTNRRKVLLQKDIGLLLQIKPLLEEKGLPVAAFNTTVFRCFSAVKMRTPGVVKAYSNIMKTYPFPNRPAILKFSEQKIFFARTNDELVNTPALLKPFLHYVLIDVEISATEICSYNILRYQRMPVAFITDMARQIWDEARHAKIIWELLRESGAELGDYTYSNVVLRRYLKAQSLEEALAIQQLLQEGNAVEINMLLIKSLRKARRNEWADIFTVINIDEGLHARIGNKWLLALLKGKAPKTYNEILKKASVKIDIPVFGKGGWNPKVRKMIGFPDAFIKSLK